MLTITTKYNTAVKILVAKPVAKMVESHYLDKCKAFYPVNVYEPFFFSDFICSFYI